MTELTEKQKKDLEKKRKKAEEVQVAIQDIPYDVEDAMAQLKDKGSIKELRSCLKRSGVGGEVFLGALDGLLQEWKALNKVLDAAMKDADKEVKRINKLLGPPL